MYCICEVEFNYEICIVDDDDDDDDVHRVPKKNWYTKLISIT